MHPHIRPTAVVLLWAFSQAITVMAQPGGNDPTFNPGDAGYGKGDGFNQPVFALALLPNDQLLVAGVHTRFDGRFCNRIARLHAGGELDTTFGVGAPGYNGSVRCMQVIGDGRIYIGGEFLGLPGASTRLVARLAPDGIVDPSFSTMNILASGRAEALVVQPDGKVLLAGLVNLFGNSGINIVRLDTTGHLDPSFQPGSGTGSGHPIHALVLQPDGRMLIGGDFTSYAGVACGRIARLNADGSLDTTFHAGAGFNGVVQAMALRADGRVLVAGSFSNYDGQSYNDIVQLNGDGTVDPSFVPGTGSNGHVNCLRTISDDDVMVGGSFSSFDDTPVNDLVRLNSDGSIDPVFDPGPGTPGDVNALVKRSDDRWIVAGSFDRFATIARGNIVQLLADGSLDRSAFGGTSFNAAPVALAVRPDGRMLATGGFISYRDTARAGITSLLADGGLDTTFQPGSGFTGSARCIAIQPDGKAIIGGSFQQYDGTACNRIVRLNEDGGIDETFNSGSGFDGNVWALASQNDGRCLVASSGWYNGIPSNGLVRLNSDGSLDATFTAAVGGRTLAIQPDGRILVAGGGLWRLMPDGSMDASFSPVGFTNNVNTIVVQEDGRILVGGDFATINGVPRWAIARLLPNGTLDPTYAPTGPDQAVIHALVLQPNGYLVGVGAFSFINGTYNRCIARWTPSGVLDAGFDSGLGFRNTGPYAPDVSVFALAMQPNGAIVAVGDFRSYDQVGRNRIARLLTGPCNAGDPCDDGLASTGNDVYDADCTCLGTDLCIPTQLTTTNADPEISCGAVNLKFDGTSTIAANEVPGANKYQFRFTNIPGQPAYARNIAFPTRSFTLTKWSTNPLKAGRTYNVIVRASFDNGTTWCDWGPSCTVKVSWAPLPPEQMARMALEADGPLLQVYPVPTSTFLRVLAPDAGPATVDLITLDGRIVRQVAMGADAVLELDVHDLCTGVYMLRWSGADGSVQVARAIVE